MITYHTIHKRNHKLSTEFFVNGVMATTTFYVDTVCRSVIHFFLKMLTVSCCRLHGNGKTVQSVNLYFLHYQSDEVKSSKDSYILAWHHYVTTLLYKTFL